MVNVSCELDPEVYDVAMTLKTYVPGRWKAAVLHKERIPEKQERLQVQKDFKGSYVIYPVKPGEGEIFLTK